MSDPILVAIDGSDPAREALVHALGLAERLEVPLHVLTVADVTGDPTTFGVAEVEALDRAAATLRDDVVDTVADRDLEDHDVEIHTAVRRGRPHEVIDAYAGEVDAGLILVGRSGTRDLPTALVGGTTDRLLRTSSVPVVVVPNEDGGEPD